MKDDFLKFPVPHRQHEVRGLSYTSQLLPRGREVHRAIPTFRALPQNLGKVTSKNTQSYSHNSGPACHTLVRVDPEHHSCFSIIAKKSLSMTGQRVLTYSSVKSARQRLAAAINDASLV